MKKRVEVRCNTEGVVIGALELEPGKHKITAQTFVDAFVFDDKQYDPKGKVAKNNQLARCPHCDGFLEIVGTEIAGESIGSSGKPAKRISREEARANAQRAAQSMTTGPRGQPLAEPVSRAIENIGTEPTMRIVLARTTIEID